MTEKITDAFKAEIELEDAKNEITQFKSILNRVHFFVDDIKSELAGSAYIDSQYAIKQKAHIKEAVDGAVEFYRSVGRGEEADRLSGFWKLYESLLDGCQYSLIQIKHIMESILPVIADNGIVNLDIDRKKLLDRYID